MKKSILIVHPEDKTTAFLKEIKKNINSKFQQIVESVNIPPDEIAHIKCLEKISQLPKDSLIIFLGHGRSDRLYGSRGKYFYNIHYASPLAIEQNSEHYYSNENFINKDNIEIFSNKKIFCLACSSGENVAKHALEHGAKVFLGFGDIPTSQDEFKKIVNANVKFHVMIREMKNEINHIVKTSLIYSISNSYSFDQLYNLIQFLTNQRITRILTHQKKFKERYAMADCLYYFKKEINILGDKKLKLID